jgi:hypothetical protein
MPDDHVIHHENDKTLHLGTLIVRDVLRECRRDPQVALWLKGFPDLLKERNRAGTFRVIHPKVFPTERRYWLSVLVDYYYVQPNEIGLGGKPGRDLTSNRLVNTKGHQRRYDESPRDAPMGLAEINQHAISCKTKSSSDSHYRANDVIRRQGLGCGWTRDTEYVS